jgi:glycosyltransferase involved in cell wall biosynthesis
LVDQISRNARILLHDTINQLPPGLVARKGEMLQQANLAPLSNSRSVEPTTEATMVSICIPTFNNAGMVAEAIQSALRQTYQHLEILVVDNCSTDETEQVVKGFMSRDPRLHYLRQAQNVGMPGNFNTCLASARGEYVLILCSDDILEAGCVAALVSALVASPASVLAACARTFVNAKLRPLKIVRARSKLEVIDGLMVIRDCVARGNRIGEPSAVLFRRDAASRGFDSHYSQLLDLEMWIHLATKGSAVFLPEALCQIRQHGEQLTITNFRSGRLVEEKRRLFRNELSDRRASLPFLCKAAWDIRMVVSIARVRLFEGQVDAKAIDEVYYKPLYLMLALMLDVGWPLVRSLVSKSRRRSGFFAE